MSRHILAKNTPISFSHAAKQTPHPPPKKRRTLFFTYGEKRCAAHETRGAPGPRLRLVVKERNLRNNSAPAQYFTTYFTPWYVVRLR